MLQRVILYLLALIIIGCADVMDNQIIQQNLIEGELLDSNVSTLVTRQVNEKVDKPIHAKTPHVAEQGLEFLQATKPRMSPKSETFSSTDVQVYSIEPKNSLEEEDEDVAEPAAVIEKLIKFESSLPKSQKPAEKPVELPNTIAPGESSSKKSDKKARLHRGMPSLNLWYSN